MGRLPIVVLFVWLASINVMVAHDWPTYRADAARSGLTEEPLSPRLFLRWTYHPGHAPEPAWPRDDRMSFDRVHHVAIADGRVFFGNTVDGKVYALDAETGEPQWSLFTDAPVRFAPTVWKDRVLVVSDDGFLYCLKCSDGTLIYKRRGGPRDDRVLGHGHIVSKWPARGAPAIRDDILYWAAGIWQSEGIYMYAMDPQTGDVQWTNDRSGQIDMPQPHGGANAASGVTAQGYLVATDRQLFVPTGRAVPAAFARVDGNFQYYRLQKNSPRGGSLAMAVGPLVYNGGSAFQASDGQLVADGFQNSVCQFSDGVICGSDNRLRALKVVAKETFDRSGKPIRRWDHELLWQIEDVPSGTSVIVAGQTAVSAGGSRIATVDLSTRNLIWKGEVDDTAYGLAAAGGRLYVSTASGAIHCFGEKETKPAPAAHQPPKIAPRPDPQLAAAAEEIIKRSGITAGYCVDLGCGNGGLALELARRTDLRIVGIDSDPEKVKQARQRLDAAGYYGSRVTVHLGDPSRTQYPKYFANLVVSQQSLSPDAGTLDAESRRLQKPFGGVICVGTPGAMRVARRGALEDTGEWTHLYADPANTLCSTDTVKGPLSVLWFRDVDFALPQRHGRGPAPLFRDGRLFVEGLDGLIAVDAYNGRRLWRFERKGILDAYDADHLAGTAITGSNFCVAGDSVFLRHGHQCFRLDAATGKTLATYETPQTDAGKPATWGYIACENGILFGSIANTEHVVRHAYLRADDHMTRQFSESSALFALDVTTGRMLWRYNARESIRHNAIAIGDGRVFLIDRALAHGDLLSLTQDRRGQQNTKATHEHPPGLLLALDTRTGKELWSTDDDVFGTTLAFSQPYQALLVCYQSTRFRLPSEVGDRMAVHNAIDGGRLWTQKVDYQTRPLINGGTIVAYPTMLDLLTGESKSMEFVKSYGCGQLSGSKHLLLFRSATFSYYDFQRNIGVENFGGVRPGCWINALPVGGIVLLPDASAGCRCSYQNRAWMAFEGR